jgi:small subunit ribosomal protein S24e
MTYMLFGAYHLLVTRRGLECDGWLPVTGNLYALDDVQRLKTLFEKCMLRVFEGVGKSLTRGRDERRRDTQSHVRVQHGSSRIQDDGDRDEDMEDGEKESDDEDDQRVEKSRNSGPLTGDEVKELELLTTDVVKVLEAYASEREGGSVAVSRPASRPQSPGLQGVRGMTNGHGGAGGNGLGGGGGGAYRPPGRR